MISVAEDLKGARVKNEIAVVTGGSQGLGRAVAEEIIARGGRVAALARRQQPLQEAKARLGERYLPIVADIADAASVAMAYAQVDAVFGVATILINAAGVYRPCAIDTATDADFHDHIDTNLLGPLNMIRAAVPRMRASGRGDIVNVSSESVHRPFPFLAIYAATKAGLEALTAGLAPELRGSDIRLSVFRVGRMHTEGAASAAAFAGDPDMLERYRDLVAKGGYFQDVGSGMDPRVPARALVDVLCTERTASATFVTFQSR